MMRKVRINFLTFSIDFYLYMVYTVCRIHIRRKCVWKKIMLNRNQIQEYVNLFSEPTREELSKKYLDNDNYLYLEKFSHNDFEGYDCGLYDKDGLVDKADYDNFMAWIGK